MDLNVLNEEISLWDGDLLLDDPFVHFGNGNGINTKLPGLVRLDIADQGVGITAATQAYEFKPELDDDFQSELFQNFNQLSYDCSLHDWMLEKMDFDLIDDIITTGNCISDDLFNLEEFGLTDNPNTQKYDLPPSYTNTIGMAELTPPVSPEGIELGNTLQPEQFNLKYVSESLIDSCKNSNCTSDILQTPPVSPELNYPNEMSPDTSFSSDQSAYSSELNFSNEISPGTSFSSDQDVNSSSFQDFSLFETQLKKTVHRNHKSSQSKTSVSKKSTSGIKKDRKRSQNRNAATRYRIKKRGEIDELQHQCHLEETRNKELKTKVSEISREVNYLKDLMKEIIESRHSKIQQIN